MDPETRESLIARLPDHADTAAWDEFVGLYQPLIYGIGRRHGLQPNDASDLVQEVLIAVANCVDRFEPNEQRGRFRSWLFRVARNQSLLRLRKLRKQSRSMLTDQTQHWVDPSEGQLRSDEEFEIALRRRAFRWAARKVRQSVQEQTWEAFARTAIDCQPPLEVANALGIDVGAVYLSRSRVMNRLKQLVQGVSGELPPCLDDSGSGIESIAGSGDQR